MSILIISPELWGAIAVIVAALIGAGATIISKGKGEKKEQHSQTSQPLHMMNSADVKSTIHILFIDDEKFENVSI